MKKPKLPLLFTCGIIILSFITGLLVGSSPKLTRAEPDPIDAGLTDPQTKVNATYARGDSYDVSAVGETFTWTTKPQFVFNGSQYVPYEYWVDGDHYVVQTGLISAELHRNKAVFYSPDLSRLAVGRETWLVFQRVDDAWVPVCASLTSYFQSQAVTEETMDSVTLTGTWTTVKGTLEVDYTFRERLKHTVTWTPNQAGKYAIVQFWNETIYEDVTLQNATVIKRSSDFILGKADSLTFLFGNDTQPFGVFENQRSAEEYLHKTIFAKGTVVYQGITITDGVAWVFYNSTLCDVDTDEPIVIDPASSTFQPPSLDGHIEYRGGAFDEADSDATEFRFGEDKAASYHWFRSYLRFDVTALPDTAIVSEAIFSIWKVWTSYDGSPEGNLYLTEIEDIGTTITSADWGRSVVIDHGIFVALADWSDEDLWVSLSVAESITGTDTFVSFRLKQSTEDGDTNAWKGYGRSADHATASQRPKLVVTYTTNSAPVNEAPVSDTTFDVDTDGWVNVTVLDAEGGYLALETVEVNVTTASSEVFILRWTNDTASFTELSDSSNVCTLNSGTSERSNINGTADTYCFYFKVNAAPIKGACSVNVTSVDSADASDSDVHAAEFSINFYLGITVNDGSHSWASMNPGTTDQALGDDGDIDVTIDANANFDLEAKGSGALASGGNSIALSNVEMHETTLGSAIDLTTGYQDIPGLTDEARGTSQAKAFKLWISIPNPQQDGSYTYTLSVKGTEH